MSNSEVETSAQDVATTNKTDAYSPVENSAIPSTMTALLLTAHNAPFELVHKHPTPKVECPNHILVKVAVAAFCHSDEMIRCPPKMKPSDMYIASQMPFATSHEGAGYVCEVGKGVRDFKVGDRVGVLAFRDPCEKCYDCQQDAEGSVPGARIYCDKKAFMGVTSDGAAAEYILADEQFVVRLPDTLPFEAAAPLMCSGGTIYKAIKASGARPGQTIAFVGIGALGHLGVQFAKAMGLRVVAVDVREAPLEMIKTVKHAPDVVLDSRHGVNAALDAIKGGGVDACVVSTHVEEAFTYGLDITRRHGVFVAAGIPDDAIAVNMRHLLFRGIIMKGVFMTDITSVKEIVNLVVEKEIEVKTHEYGLHESVKLLEDYGSASLSGKLVFRVSQ